MRLATCKKVNTTGQPHLTQKRLPDALRKPTALFIIKATCQ